MAEKRGKALAFSPGSTPSSKRYHSSRHSKPKQLDIQSQIKELLVMKSNSVLWIGELKNKLVGQFSDKEIYHALRSTPSLSGIEIHKGVLRNVGYASEDPLATPLGEPSNKREMATQTDIPIPPPPPPCDCLANVTKEFQKELALLGSKTDPSILRSMDMSVPLTREDVDLELYTRIPSLYKCMMSLTSIPSAPTNAQKSALLTVLCKLACIRNRELNWLQKVNGLRLRLNGLTKAVIDEFSRTYDCVSYVTTSRILDSFVEKNEQILLSWTGEKLQHVGDNVDVRKLVRQERSSKSVHNLHMYNNLVYRPRVITQKLDDTVPPIAESDVPLESLLLSNVELDTLKNQMVKVMVNAMKDLKKLDDKIPSPSFLHTFSPEMSQKTEYAHLGVLEKNESITSEMVDILIHCEKYQSVKTVYRGDQLTFERAKSAINLMKNTEQLKNFIPTFSDFHLQMELDQLIMKVFYNENSARDVMTLFALKVLSNSKQVNKDVRKCYNAVNLFLDKVTDALLVQIAEKEGLQLLTDTTHLYEKLLNFLAQLRLLIPIHLPPDYCPVCTQSVPNGELMNQHLTNCGVQGQNPPESMDDDYAAYFNQLFPLLLLRRVLHTSIRYGNGEIISLVIKALTTIFKANGCTKYAFACLEFSLQTQHYLSEELSHLLKHERFVNLLGKADSNIPADLFVEFDNKYIKERLTLHKGEATSKLLNRLSKSRELSSKVITAFNDSFTTSKHQKRRTRNQDQYHMDIMLISGKLERPFSNESRKLVNRRDLLKPIDSGKLKNWFRLKAKHVKHSAYL